MKSIKWNGEVITSPGVYADVPMDVYHGQDICPGPSVSSGHVRRVLEVNGGSPKHMFARWSGNPNRALDGEEEKKHFVIGRAVHHLMLGEKDFSKHFALRPPQWDSFRTNAAKDWRDEMIRSGRSVLSEADIEVIKGMAYSLGRDRLVQSGLLSGAVERSYIWRDKETGLWVKCRPDSTPTESGDFADLKTCQSVQYGDIARALRQRAYHQQAALVREGARIAAGVEMASFTFVFVEKTPPHCVRLVHLKQEDLDLGARQNRAALRLIASCIRKKSWPGPGEGHVVNIDLGTYYREQAAHDVDDITNATKGEAA